MHRKLQLSLASLLAFATLPSMAAPNLLSRQKNQKSANFDTNPNGSSFLWVIQDTYQGSKFFDLFDFFTGDDPTHGSVNYVTAEQAWERNLISITNDNKVIMKGDNTNWLPAGRFRDSVRISTLAQYNTGLFILDANKAPWGCGVWPAFWTIGSGPWPWNGEIDILEGVHDNEHNQVTWHTAPGCTLTPNANFTGSVVSMDHLSCDGTIPGNAGCGITEWSRASYGPTFDAQGGGVFAMKWDESGISVWSFYRAAVPQDIVRGEPNPSRWDKPTATLSPKGCDPLKYFANHSIIFDITFCGDWAGNSYATSGCPGTCSDRLMDPANFNNASWLINSLKVYRKQNLSGQVSSSTPHIYEVVGWLPCALAVGVVVAFLGV